MNSSRSGNMEAGVLLCGLESTGILGLGDFRIGWLGCGCVISTHRCVKMVHLGCPAGPE